MTGLVQGLRIRELTAADAPQVLRLAEEVGPLAAERLASFEQEVSTVGVSAWGVLDGTSRLAGVGLARQWGRQAHVAALTVAPAARRQGIGGQLLETLVGVLLGDRAAVLGAEVPADDLLAAALFARHGFRAAQVAWALERPVGDLPAPQGEPAADPLTEGPGSGGAQPRRANVLGAEASEAALEAVARLAASLDSELDPSSWLAGGLAAGWAHLVTGPAASEAGEAAAIIVPAGDAEALSCKLVLVDEGAPFPGLTSLVRVLLAEARERGARRLVLPGPARSWEAWSHLQGLGFVPARPTVRFTRLGHAEVADARRACLVSWR